MLGLLPPGGSLLDVGAGTGRASLPIAVRGYSLTAVERNPEMAAVLRAEAAVAGAQVRVIGGSWPEAAEEAGRHDVVLSAHVVYDVGDLAPFLAVLHRAARVAVVLEAGDRHPWARLIPYYRVLHSLARPDGPTGDLLVEVVDEVVGAHPHVERWVSATRLPFADLQELVEFYRRRLLVPVERAGELADLLAPNVVEQDGWLSLGGEATTLTLWWETGWDNSTTGASVRQCTQSPGTVSQAGGAFRRGSLSELQERLGEVSAPSALRRP